jgi:hypothetical protein
MAHKNLTLTLGKAVFPLDSPQGCTAPFCQTSLRIYRIKYPGCSNTMNKHKYRLPLGCTIRAANMKCQTNRVGRTKEMQGTQ